MILNIKKDQANLEDLPSMYSNDMEMLRAISKNMTLLMVKAGQKKQKIVLKSMSNKNLMKQETNKNEDPFSMKGL